MFIGRSDIEDLYTVRRGGGDGVDHLLHLSISRVMVADIEAQDRLRPRDVLTVWTACVKVELFLSLREGRRKQQ